MKKNILFVTADEFRADCLGAAGNPVIQTPHLDALAGDGALFTHHFVQSAPCGPSRMCIYTGRYMCGHRSVDNMTPLVEAEENLATYLREAGYEPALIGYNDYAVDPRILPDGDPRKTSLNYDSFLPGFDVVLDHEHYSPEYFAMLRKKGYPEELCNRSICFSWAIPPEGPGEHLPLHYPALYRAEDSECAFVTDVAIEYIRAHAGHPWILNVNYIKPHSPMVCPAPYHRMYAPEAMPAANRRSEELAAAHPYFRFMHREKELPDERELREFRACYYGMISEVDACLGRLFAALRATGQWENTLIVFTSDHGEYMGDHFLGGKGHFYDEGMWVPLIIRDPAGESDATRGRRIDTFTESIDLTPTMLEWLSLSVPDRVQGRSLLACLGAGGRSPHREAIHYEYDFRNAYRQYGGVPMAMDDCVLWVVRDNQFKYVQFGSEMAPSLLFDLRADPGEYENLADRAEYAPVVAAYAQRMLRWRMRYEDQRMEHWAAPYR